MPTHDEEFIDLQMRVTFQEDMLHQLNEVVSQQNTEILLLREQVRALARRLEEFIRQPSQPEGNIPDERPPHY